MAPPGRHRSANHVVPMTRYQVQYDFPVENPVSNVSIYRGKEVIEFLVPLNHPDAHNMGFQDLLAAAELSGLCHLPTKPIKKIRVLGPKNSEVEKVDKSGEKRKPAV